MRPAFAQNKIDNMLIEGNQIKCGDATRECFKVQSKNTAGKKLRDISCLILETADTQRFLDLYKNLRNKKDMLAFVDRWNPIPYGDYTVYEPEDLKQIEGTKIVTDYVNADLRLNNEQTTDLEKQMLEALKKNPRLDRILVQIKGLEEDFVLDIKEKEPYKNPKKVETKELPYCLMYKNYCAALRKEAAEHFEKALKDYGRKMGTNYAYRSYQLQAKQGYEHQKNAKCQSIAEPGYSQHQLGLAIDIKDSSAINWLNKNAGKYGFTLAFPQDGCEATGYKYEWWHWRYVTPYGAQMEKEFFTQKYDIDAEETEEKAETEKDIRQRRRESTQLYAAPQHAMLSFLNKCFNTD
ncbi:MAG: M15 family metallopeptidase [Elusimicrobiota bacterium]|nr:M15 family metallopeptidase [Elusimicrobiota bacterium]